MRAFGLLFLSLSLACTASEDVPMDDAGTTPDMAVVGPRCPDEMALVPMLDGNVCVDRYEAAVVLVLPDGREQPWPYDRPVDGMVVRAIVQSGIKPQAYISGAQAGAACRRAGKRLCTEKEWLAACQGPQNFTYPYGNTYMHGACNEGRTTNPVNDCFGPGSGVFTYANMNDPCCEGKPNTVASGGTFSRCRSAYGIYDLHGNLHEWIDATTETGNGIFKGGFFVDAYLNGAGCLYRTTAHAKTYHDYSTGFRCCAAPLTQ
jgi:formylglycine-generating enzyme required for sulfatase activity